MLFRPATVADAKALLDIYAPYVIKTAITFEYDVPSLEEFTSRIENISKKFPYIVAEDQVDGEKRIVGYSYADTFHARDAYDQSVEISIYVDENLKRRGIGRALYAELETELRARYMKNMYACIAYAPVEDEYLTNDSVRFHERLGFELCGRFHECGIKFDRWYDMVYMEKILR